jgi:hypothetical protein
VKEGKQTITQIRTLLLEKNKSRVRNDRLIILIILCFHAAHMVVFLQLQYFAFILLSKSLDKFIIVKMIINKVILKRIFNCFACKIEIYSTKLKPDATFSRVA